MGNNQGYKDYHVRFRYRGKDTIIACGINESFKDVIDRYIEQSKLSADELNFFLIVRMYIEKIKIYLFQT